MKKKLFFDFSEGIAPHNTSYRLSVLLFGDRSLLMFGGKHEQAAKAFEQKTTPGFSRRVM